MLRSCGCGCVDVHGRALGSWKPSFHPLHRQLPQRFVQLQTLQPYSWIMWETDVGVFWVCMHQGSAGAAGYCGAELGREQVVRKGLRHAAHQGAEQLGGIAGHVRVC